MLFLYDMVFLLIECEINTLEVSFWGGLTEYFFKALFYS